MTLLRDAAPGREAATAAAPAAATIRTRRPLVGLVVLALAAAALIGWLASNHDKAAPAKAPQAVAVTVAQASLKDMPVLVHAIGAAQAWQGAALKAQVSGRLVAVPVGEGMDVAKGALLAQLDPAPYQAMLMQARGALTRDEALLANSRLDLQRYATLVEQDSISRQQLDTVRALVKQHEGVVQIDRGAVASAQVNLGYTRILAPFAGRIGVRNVDAGNLVSPTDTSGILTLNQIDPIAVVFSVPQGEFARLSDASDRFRRRLAVEAFSQETGERLGSGELAVADNHVDAATGTVQLKARFSNAGRRLWPGQLINVRLVLRTLGEALTVPAAAVNQGPKGTFVYVVGKGAKAVVRPVKVSLTSEGSAVIASGLKAGERVVTDGQLSLRDGSTVQVKPATGG